MFALFASAMPKRRKTTVAAKKPKAAAGTVAAAAKKRKAAAAAKKPKAAAPAKRKRAAVPRRARGQRGGDSCGGPDLSPVTISTGSSSAIQVSDPHSGTTFPSQCDQSGVLSAPGAVMAPLAYNQVFPGAIGPGVDNYPPFILPATGSTTTQSGGARRARAKAPAKPKAKAAAPKPKPKATVARRRA